MPTASVRPDRRRLLTLGAAAAAALPTLACARMRTTATPPALRWGPVATPRVISTVSTNVPEDFEPPGASMYHVRKVFAAWGSSALSLIKDADGRIVDMVYGVMGGGHGDTGWDGVLAWRQRTLRWEQVLAPTRADPVPHDNIDPVYGEVPDGTRRPASQHAYQHLQGLDSDEGAGAAMVQLRAAAAGRGARTFGQAHRFAWDTRTWSRFGQVVPPGSGEVCNATLKDTRRKRFVRVPSDNYTAWFWIGYTDLDADARWHTETQPPRSGQGWGNVVAAVGVYDPVRDLYLFMAQGPHVWAVRADDMGREPMRLLRLAGDPIPASIASSPWIWRSATGEFVLPDTGTAGPPGAVFYITPPAPDRVFTDAWQVVRRPFAGTSRFDAGNSAGQIHNRWQYAPHWDALIVAPGALAPMERWQL